MNRETCTQSITVAHSNSHGRQKVAQKRKGSELTVDSVKKTLFQTPIKEEEGQQINSDVTETSHTISNHVTRFTSKQSGKSRVSKREIVSKQQSQASKSQKGSVFENSISKTGRPLGKENAGGGDGDADNNDDVESDQDVFSGEEEVDMKKLKIGGAFMFDPDRNISDMLADALATTEVNRNMFCKLQKVHVSRSKQTEKPSTACK